MQTYFSKHWALSWSLQGNKAIQITLYIRKLSMQVTHCSKEEVEAKGKRQAYNPLLANDSFESGVQSPQDSALRYMNKN